MHAQAFSARYRTTNWSAYNAALCKRGSLSVWFDLDMVWQAEKSGKRGRPETFSDAALDSPSVTGAYRFVVTPGEATRMEVDARLFFRRDIEQLGIAPLISMFLFCDNDPGAFDDYRNAVHDSDALVMESGGASYIRPLTNPPCLGTPISAPATRSPSVFCSAAASSSTTSTAARITSAAPRWSSSRSASGGRAPCG